MTKKKATKKESVKKTAKKKVSSKKVAKPINQTEIKKIRSRLITCLPEEIRAAFTQLNALGEGDDEWTQALSPSAINKLVNSWSPEIFDTVLGETSCFPKIQESFKSVSLQRFTKLSEKRQSEVADLFLNSLTDALSCLFGELIGVHKATQRGSTLVDIVPTETITQLTEAAALHLVKSKKGLDLDKLECLTARVAGILSKNHGYVSLGAVEELLDEVIEQLSTLKHRLYLRGLKTISPAGASALGMHREELWLTGLVNLPEAVADGISKHEGKLLLGDLDLPWSEPLDGLAATYLSQHKGELFLNSVTQLTDSAAENLSSHDGPLFLGGLTKLSDSAAESLSRHAGLLSLRSIESLSEPAAESLSKHQGTLDLRPYSNRDGGLFHLSDAAATSLSKHPDLFVGSSVERQIEAISDKS